MDTDTVTDKNTDRDKDIDTYITNKICELLLRIHNNTIGPIAPYGVPLTYHGANSKGAIYSTCKVLS